jgi:hypothetical protein
MGRSVEHRGGQRRDYRRLGVDVAMARGGAGEEPKKYHRHARVQSGNAGKEKGDRG